MQVNFTLRKEQCTQVQIPQTTSAKYLGQPNDMEDAYNLKAETS